MNVTLSPKIEALLRRATDAGATQEEQRTAAHIAARLIMRAAGEAPAHAPPPPPPQRPPVDYGNIYREVVQEKRASDAVESDAFRWTVEDEIRRNFARRRQAVPPSKETCVWCLSRPRAPFLVVCSVCKNAGVGSFR